MIKKILRIFLVVVVLVFLIYFFRNNFQQEAQDINLSPKNSLFSFVVYGDSRDGYEIHRGILSLIQAKNPDFVVNVGDMVNNGCDADLWDNYLDIVKDVCVNQEGVVCNESSDYLDTKYYPVIGNHDKVDECPDNYFTVFPFLKKEGEGQRYYSFGYQNSYFIVLDSVSDGQIDESSEQYIWLRNQLEIAQDYEFIFVFFHNPPYSSGGHEDDPEIKKFWVPLFKEYNVDMVFNGHSHHYARHFADGISYVVTGGGGAPLKDINESEFTIYAEKVNHYVLVDINNQNINLTVYDIDNAVIDEYYK